MAKDIFYNVSGIILSGGKGRRMKREKGLCLLGGKPLISYVLNVLNKNCDQIIISANNDAYGNFGFPVVNDEIKNVGPIGGILAGLNKSKTHGNIIVSCDMPFVSEDLIRYIMDSSTGYEVVIPVFNGWAEPLCGYYTRTIIPDLEKMIENKIYKLQEISHFANTRMLEISSDMFFYKPDLFSNINSPEDLALAEKQINNLHGK